MRYRIARDGMLFGPYTDAEVVRYLASGNILPTDLAQAEGTEDWLPVLQLFPAAGTGPVAATGAQTLYQDPPDFPWWAVLLLTVFTYGLFTAVWGVVQAAWLHRIDNRERALWLNLAYLILFLIRLPGTYHDVAHNVFGGPRYYHPHWLGMGLVSFALWLASRFVFRDELLKHFNTREPIGLRLSALMTFFFATIYFQYHFNRINEVKRAMHVSVPG